VFEPPPAVSPPVQPGPTAAELAEQRREERERKRREEARKRAEREARERAAAFKLIRQQTKAEAGEGYGLAAGTALPPPPVVPVQAVESPETVAAEPAVAEVAEPESTAAAVVPGGSSTDSGLSGAAPILIGLLGISVLLLGMAAIPPAHAHGSLGTLLVRRRFELGLLGTAVLASAAIGLVIAVAVG
jgi:hypothetical protein